MAGDFVRMSVAERATLEMRSREITRRFADFKCQVCSQQQGRSVWVREDLWSRHNQEVHLVRDDQTWSGPQFFSQTAASLIHSQQEKVLKLLENRCIEYVGGEWICKPVKGYNKRTYHLEKLEGGEFSCDCQHYRKEQTACSHIGALKEYMARGQRYD